MKALAIGFVLALTLGAYTAWTPEQHDTFNWSIFAGVALWGTVLLWLVVDFALDLLHQRRTRFASPDRTPRWVASIGWVIGIALWLPLIALADLFLSRAGVCEGWIDYHRFSGIVVCRRMAVVILIVTLVGAVLAIWTWARDRR